MTLLTRRVRNIALPAVLCAVFASTALAHHGWSWTEEDFFELKGTIAEIYIGNPHATLDVNADDGMWRVEMAPPSRTIAAGFTEETAKAGDAVTAIGHRSLDHSERRMKAVRIVVGGKTYDVYPDRLPPD